MTYLTKLATNAFSALFILTVAASAQETDNQAGDLALGEQIIDGVAVGRSYTREVYGDWQLRCVRTDNEKDPCRLYQLLLDQDENSVAELSLFELKGVNQAVAGATVAVPLETSLTEQLTVSVDGGSTKRYPFSYCTVQGCFARIGLTAQDISGFQRGSRAVMTIVPVAAPDTRVDLNLSLSGFTDGFNALLASNAAIAQN